MRGVMFGVAIAICCAVYNPVFVYMRDVPGLFLGAPPILLGGIAASVVLLIALGVLVTFDKRP